SSSVSGENSILLGSRNTLSANNEAYIGNAATASIGGAVNWTATSDGRFKQNVQENVPGLDFIAALRPVTYNFDVAKMHDFQGNGPLGSLTDAATQKSTVSYSGFIAQEVERAAQNLGYDFSGVKVPENPDEQAYGLRYAEFVVPLTKAVQELNQKVEDQEQVIAKQSHTMEQYQETMNKYESIMAQMEARMQALEAKVEQQASQPSMTGGKK
ncbi:MAG: tail fiber domain-containing protein, partial [Bacteroidota bacterium]